MNGTRTLETLTLASYPTWRSGKVREIYDLGDEFLFVATDRVSAFDVILPTLIPGKGRTLTSISRFWFDHTARIVPNHVVSYSLDDLELLPTERDALTGRSMVVRKADRIDVECVVRGRLAGSGLEEYRNAGTLAGEPLPTGLVAGDRLPELRFTPATKNDSGHDVNISIGDLRQEVGQNLAELLESTSKALFLHAERIAGKAGFVLADTKFEFGFIDNDLTLIDEVLTPDSSRYWSADELVHGASPHGYDKQVIRDWLLASGWNREPPSPVLPHEIVELAASRYTQVLERLERATNINTNTEEIE